MLIVTFIFMLMAVALSQIFISFNQLHRRVADKAVLGQDMRYAMEAIVREARNDTIDYSAGPAEKDAILKLFKSNGIHIWIARESSTGSPKCQDTIVSHCLMLSIDDGATWTQVTANRVDVTNFDVYLEPTQDPFIKVGGSYPNNIQPYVTVSLGLKYISDQPKENVTLQAQTTVSSRIYQR